MELTTRPRLGQSSPSRSTPTPIVGLRSEFHHTSVGNWVGGKKQRCAEQRTRCGARERAAAYRARHAALNYMHVHYNLISGREREEPIVQIHEYEHSDHLVFNACVCLSTLVLFATPWHGVNSGGVSDISGRFGALDQVDLDSIQSNAPSRCRVRSLHGSDCMQSLIPSQQVHCL